MIWDLCDGEEQLIPIQGELCRLIESQEQMATLGYVDTLEEQALLEDMLEQIKPPYPDDSEELHYLLKTPFRYPPLKWGSRFGRVHEPGIFYAGKGRDVTLAESAYYRFVFWSSIAALPVKENIRTEHQLFTVHYKAEKAVRLHAMPFTKFEKDLTNVSSYSSCHQIGTKMRESGVTAFEYTSARDPAKGICVGLFTPEPFVEKRPQGISRWLCETSATEVAFKQLSSSRVSVYPIEQFLVGGELPFPA